jgi:hypothetical protein
MTERYCDGCKRRALLSPLHGPEKGVSPEKRPDGVILVRVQRRDPQAPSFAKAPQRVAPFYRHVALVDVVGVAVVRHSNLGRDPQDHIAERLAGPRSERRRSTTALSSQMSFSPRSLVVAS